MRHSHGHFHGKNRGVKVSAGERSEETLSRGYFSIAREGLSLCVGVGVSVDFHGDFHGLIS
jgi:hypothetical protein